MTVPDPAPPFLLRRADALAVLPGLWLLLYGTGWQVDTPTPDDVVYEAMVGDDANPAVPGYDPDLSAELYTTNGETTESAHARPGQDLHLA